MPKLTKKSHPFVTDGCTDERSDLNYKKASLLKIYWLYKTLNCVKLSKYGFKYFALLFLHFTVGAGMTPYQYYVRVSGVSID